MSKLSVYLYADSWRCSGRHDNAQGISLRITEDMVAQCFAAFGAE
jgi:hypothetical protein